MFKQRLDKCEKCKKSISDNNRPIICEKCTTVHCEKCWIKDEQYHFCPWCFQIPLNNKQIVYESGTLFNCEDDFDTQQDTNVMDNCNNYYDAYMYDNSCIRGCCGHTRCERDYSAILSKQTIEPTFFSHHSHTNTHVSDGSTRLI